MQRRNLKDEVPPIQVVSEQAQKELAEYYRNLIDDDRFKIKSTL